VVILCGGGGTRPRERTFCAAYADGVAHVDLGAPLEGHREAGVAATRTVVRPNLKRAVAEIGAVVWNVDGPKSADIERFSAHQQRGPVGHG